MLTDKEVLCEFMEPKPKCPPEYWAFSGHKSFGGWWQALLLDAGVNVWGPCDLTFDCLYKIEEVLTEEQWIHYLRILMYGNDTPSLSRIIIYSSVKISVHASPKQKITALATVLRKISS